MDLVRLLCRAGKTGPWVDPFSIDSNTTRHDTTHEISRVTRHGPQKYQNPNTNSRSATPIFLRKIHTPILFKISYLPHSQEDSSNNFSLQSFYILRVGIPYFNPVIHRLVRVIQDTQSYIPNHRIRMRHRSRERGEQRADCWERERRLASGRESH